MPQLVCPMCGKFSGYDSFSPCEDFDIYAVEIQGLGRGKGVKVVGKYSIMDPSNEVTKNIGNRVLTLLAVLLEKGCIYPSEVRELLPEDDEADLDEEDPRDEVIGEYVDEVDDLNLREAQARKGLAEAEEKLRKIKEGLI